MYLQHLFSHKDPQKLCHPYWGLHFFQNAKGYREFRCMTIKWRQKRHCLVFLIHDLSPMVQGSITKAVKICPDRLEVRRTARSLDSEINRLKVKITTQQEQQGDREEVVRYPIQTSAYYLSPVVSWCDVHMQTSSGACFSHIQGVSQGFGELHEHGTTSEEPEQLH